MSPFPDLDPWLRHWPFRPGEISAREVRAHDGRTVLLMRVELGVLQLETEGRPDGERPGGAETYLDNLISRSVHEGEAFQLDEEDQQEVDRELFQFYQRRLCWKALRRFDRAVADADHTLELVDFARRHSPDDEWLESHQQHRIFVLFHRTEAAALGELERSSPEAAIEEINMGLTRLRECFDPVKTKATRGS